MAFISSENKPQGEPSGANVGRPPMTDERQNSLGERYNLTSAASFRPLSREELAGISQDERMMYYYERDIAKYNDDIDQSETEIGILDDIADTVEKNEVTEERCAEFIKRVNGLKKVPGGDATAYLENLLKRYKNEGSSIFKEQINIHKDFITARKRDIAEQEKQRAEYIRDNR